MLIWKKNWIYRIIIHLCCVFVLISTLDAQKYTADNWRPLDIRQVKVNGEIGRRIDITINNNVLVLNADRDFLRPFQDKKLEGGYIGLGKFIDCVVRFAAYSNTSGLLEFKQHIISEIIKTQEEDGYIGILASEYRMWDLWDIHEMGYIVLGLTNNYKYFKEEESLKAAEKLAGYIIDKWSVTPNRITNSWVSVNVTTTGLENAMLALYGQTNKQQYLDFCVKGRKLPEWNVGIIEGRWGGIEGHAYSYLCRCLAQLQLYNIKPDPELLVNSQKAMDFLTRQDGLLIPGLCSYHECWHSNQHGFFKLGETCATAYMLRWLNTLLQMKGESQYGDIMERIIYNGLFAAQSPDGRRLRYYSPFEGDRVYFDGDTYCCPCNYRRIVAELPGMIYYRWNEGLAINLYTESTASFNLKKDLILDVRQETDYPNSGKVAIFINPNKTTEFPLRLRIPGWCRKAYVSINGESFDVEKQGGSYITLDRKWRKGDKVELEMFMPFRLVKGRKTQEGRVAVMRGPQLFCLNPDRQENFNPEIMKLLYIDPTSLELSDVDSLIRPRGLTCQAYCWDPNNYQAQSKAPIKLVLTEYADPGCQATYFLVRNPNSDIFVNDELFESSFTTVYATGDSTFLDKSLTRDAMLRLEKETQKPEPGGYELANIFIKDLVENGPVEINAFDIVEQFEKESSVIDNLMNNNVSLLGGYDPQDVGSPVNWYHTPKGDLQWPTHLSRHQWLNPLARAWRATKDPVYSQKIVDILLDWIDENAIGNDGLTWGSDEPGTINKGGVASEGFFKNYVDGPWTSLSAHSRLHSWTYLLVMIHDSPQMTNRNVSIIFNSLSNDHRKSMIYHPRRMNQYIAIATSMVNLSWYYPFLKGSSEAGEMGLERVQHFALTEIYPDGSMAECSQNYAKGSLERVHKVVRQDQLRGGTLFEKLDDKICKAMRYFYLSSDPQGNSPRIAKGGNSVLPLIDKLVTNCNDPQIQYLSFKGEEGQEPGFLSKAYNWAGHIIFRSGWSEDASWLFFEPGPRGSGHADAATLNLQLQSKGEWLLTDPGYFSYSTAGEDGEMAKYMRSSAAHNLALVDKQNQIYYEWGKGRVYNSKPGKYNWSDNGKIAYAEGSYDFGFGEKGKIKVTHKRQITYNREQDKFIIKDIFEGNGDHQIDLHWQLPPSAEFKKDKSNFSVTNGRAAARFNVACNKSFSIESAKGSKSPFSGWFSLHYGELEPSITVKVLTEGKLPITFTTEIDID